MNFAFVKELKQENGRDRVEIKMIEKSVNVCAYIAMYQDYYENLKGE